MKAKSVAILLAVYEPDLHWLGELLDSLDAQTYPNIRLYVRDDASPTTGTGLLTDLLGGHIRKFPWSLQRNEQNLGSNATFEALLRDCNEDYIAFCDQDDIWLPDKIENSVRLMETSPLSPLLVCTNVSVMDGKGKEIATDMEHHRRRHTFLRGNGLATQLFFRNFVMGCTILMERTRALSYLPFPNEVVHDHYLAFRAANDGALDYLAEPQMKYRVYGGNQTGVMVGVTCKEDYFRNRIELFSHRMEIFAQHAPDLPGLTQIRQWCDARIRNYRREKGSFSALWKLAFLNRSTTLFELFALRAPEPLFRLAIRMVQKRML